MQSCTSCKPQCHFIEQGCLVCFLQHLARFVLRIFQKLNNPVLPYSTAVGPNSFDAILQLNMVMLTIISVADFHRLQCDLYFFERENCMTLQFVGDYPLVNTCHKVCSSQHLQVFCRIAQCNMMGSKEKVSLESL